MSGSFVPLVDLSPFPAPEGATRTYHSMIKLLGKFRMSDEILELHIFVSTSRGQDRDEVVFSWQGKEATLAFGGIGKD